MESPKTAVTSLGTFPVESRVDDNAVCTDEAASVVNVPRRRKIADGFSFDSLDECQNELMTMLRRLTSPRVGIPFLASRSAL